MMRTTLFRTMSVAVALTMFAGTPLGAQSVERSVAVGIAVPTGGLGVQRTAGPTLRAAATFGDRQRRPARLRLELEAAWLRGDERRPAVSSWSAGTFRAVSGLASIVIGAVGTPRVAPYLTGGLGLQRMSVAGVTNPYGLIFGVRGGAGLQWQVGRRTMFAEVSSHAALSDFGTTSDFATATYIPLTVGIQF